MLCRNPHFIVMIAPLAPALRSKNAEAFFFCFGFENPHHPKMGRGRIAMPLYYPYGKFLHDCVQVIRHYRNRGMPSGGGGAPENVMITIGCFLQSSFF